MLVTSRERLGLHAELLLDLAGLPLPGAAGRATAAGAGPGGRAALRRHRPRCCSRARCSCSSSAPSRRTPALPSRAETAPGVVEICRLVAGLPLGIVLAAAWVRHFPPARIAAAIRANLDFLASTARDAAPQHRSLRAVFEHSWDLLADEEQRVFRQPGGVSGRVGRGGRRAGRRGARSRAPVAGG